ncbi:Rhodopsin domain-containing protein [Madurella fahalii]|uniref:Rhodopsin domain-containing protein n=1 Tax=Madurella fahalii TaxID=1157608 RepID=A0ABQ0GJ65_9PEZI
MPWSEDDRGPALLATVWALQGITLVVYAIRIRSRLTPKFALTAADYMITMSLIARSISTGFATAAILNGFGKHTVDIPRSGLMVLGNYLFATFLTGVPAACFARISIACLLLQITLSRRWRILIWAVIVLQALFMITYDAVHLTQCRSVISQKVRVDTTSCLTPSQVWSFTYANISVSMFSDFVCAVIPICLIHRLTRSLVEKVLVAILLASSLFATACGIPKLYYMINFDFTSTDGYFLMTNQFFWSRFEEGIIIIAACAPLLKVPVERFLARLGFPTFETPVPDEFVMVSSSRINVCDLRRDAGPGLEKQSWAPGSTTDGLGVGGSASTASERSYHLYGSGHDQGLRG